VTGALHSRLFQTSAAAALAVIIIAIGYLGTRGQPPTQNPPVEKLSIAIPITPHAALLHIAVAKGYFAEEGLEVTTMPTIHGKAAIELVVQGKADLGAASDVVFVLSAAKGGGLGIAANMLSASNDLAVVARRDRGITAPSDLAGKRVGVTLGAAGEYFLWAFLIRQKLPPGSVTLVDMPPGEIAPGLAAGIIDAASTWQPNVLDAQLALSDNAVTFYEPLAYAETFDVVGRSDFLKAHSTAIEKLVRAILKSEQFNRAHPEEALNLVAEWLKIDVKSMWPAWKDFNFRVDLQQSQLITMEEEARWALARGYVEKGPIPNFLPNLYLDALLAVQPERVTVIH
jgi:ABC-type nitrate/sulfonate/bicarbonate transport system substrate-binding protein